MSPASDAPVVCGNPSSPEAKGWRLYLADDPDEDEEQPVLFEAVLALCPRDDRHPDRRVFENVTADRLRTAIARACTAAGVPVFSPHDLRHRRISLLHLGGVPWARIGEHVGQRDFAVTANTSHVLTEERELDYPALLTFAASPQ